MIKQDMKIFRDNVHGYIKILQDFVKEFIDTEIFQRLRSIEQTGMRTLYASARHDRFIHSLGTYYLGCKAFSCYRENVERYFSSSIDNKGDHFHIFCGDDEKNTAFWNKCGLLFEIACLLHDCGHSPFSHSLEFFYEQEQMDPEFITLKNKLKEQLGSSEFTHDFDDQGSPHERMSALMVCTEFRDKIDILMVKYGLGFDDDSSNVEFISRMIIGCEYQKETKTNQIRNCLVNLLNSTSIDVDSLDYIIRDSKLSGIDNMSVDVDRLLGSLTLVEITSFKNKQFNDVDIETNIINGLFEKSRSKARFFGRARGKFFVQNEIEGSLKGLISLKGDIKILNDAKFKPSNSNVIIVNGASYDDIRVMRNSSSIELYGFMENDINVSGHEITLKEEFNGQVSLSADRFEFDSTYVNAKLNGEFSGDLLGNYTRLGGKLRCQLGFHKSSLSVIQNVIIARNYEYQWIVSHHKVVYSANYLIIELLKTCVRYLIENEKNLSESPENALAKIFSWETMINHSNSVEEYKPYNLCGQKFFRPTDSDIMALFKKCQIDCIEKKTFDNRCYKLLTEYYTRRYKKSLWKSYAEFNIFFSDFSSDEKRTIYKLFMSNTKHGVSKKYGYFNDEWQETFDSFGLEKVVWVNGDSTLKVLEPDNTFIQFKDTALTYRTVSTENDIKSVQNLDLFYLYYEDIVDDRQINVELLKEFIREKLSTYIQSPREL